MSLFRRIRDAAACVVLLALPFFFLRANLREPSKTGMIDRVVLQASAPIQYLAAQVAVGASGVIEEYVYLVEVKRDNERLRTENARLREANAKQQANAAENSRLRRLLELRDQLRGSLLSAQVIGKEVSSYFRVIRIRLDRGERDRVRHGAPVVTPDGLVGQVRRTWGRYSDVLLTVDKTSAVDVIAQRSGARGILRGTGDDQHYACKLEKVPREADLQVGDLIVTSGLGQRFPASIVVGSIAKLQKPEFGLYQDALVTPAADFSRLREVLIMTEGAPAQAVETGSGDNDARPKR